MVGSSMILRCVALYAALCVCTPAPIEKNRDLPDMEKSHEICDDLVGKNDSDTYRKRLDCEGIFKDNYIKWSEKMLTDEAFASDLEVVDVTNATSQSDESDSKREKRSIDRCPVFDDNYLEKSSLPRARSLSPWEFFINLDKNRVPRRLIDSRCLCKGCIDIRTTREDYANTLSVRLPITIPVHVRSQPTTVDVNVGCTCQLANNRH